MPHRSIAVTRTKQMPCKYCDKPVTVGRNTRKAPHHLECSIRVAVENMQQLKAKSGPCYEKWLDGMRRSLED